MKKRSDGRYSKKITVGKKQDGTPIRKEFYGRSQKEVEANIREYYQSGFNPVNKTILLSEWAERWLVTYKENSVSNRTYVTTYKNAVESHIIPYFKNAKLCEIRSADIQLFFNSKSFYSKSLLGNLKLTLNAIFETAIQNDLIVKNPVKGIKVISKAEKNVRRAYTAEEARRIIDFAKTHPYGGPVITILKTGLRVGEMLALRWSHINTKDMYISIKQAVTIKNNTPVINVPKTKSSIAEQPIDKELKDYLLSIPKSLNFVFSAGPDVQDPTNWSRSIYKKFMEDYAAYCEANNLEYEILLPHELRHTYGTLVYAATGDIYITSKLMRHASVVITAKVYVHEESKQRRAAVDKMFDLV